MTGSQVETGAPLIRLEPIGDGDEEAVASSETGPDLELPRRRRRTRRRRGPRRAAAGRAVARCCSGYDVDPQRGRRPHRLPRRPRDAARRRASTWSRPSSPLLSLFADLAELSRNRPAGEDEHTELRVHSSREHFHTYLQSLDVDRGGPARRTSATGWSGCWRHYGVHRPGPHPRAGGGGLPHLPRPAALRGRRAARHHAARSSWIERAAAGRRAAPPWPARCSSAWSGPPSCASRSSATWPAACASAGSTSRRSTPSAPACWPGCAARSPTWRLAPTPPDRAARIDALAAIPEQIVRFLAERLADGIPEREPLLEVLVRRHYREFDLHDLRCVQTRRPHVRRRRLRPRRPADPDRVHGRHARRAGRHRRRAGPRRGRSGGRARGRRRGGRRPLPHLGRRPDAPDEASARLGALLAATSCAGRRTPGGRGRLRPERPAGQLLHAAGRGRRPDRRWPRTSWSAACTRWSGAGSTSGGCATST